MELMDQYIVFRGGNFQESLVSSAHLTFVQEDTMKFMVRQRRVLQLQEPRPETSALNTPQREPQTASPEHQSVHLAEIVGGNVNPSRMVVIRFMEDEATLEGITAKVSHYWKQNARKILAVPESDFQVWQEKRRRLT